MALLWLSEIQDRFPGHTVEIHATDIDSASLARARRGIYEHGSVREVPRPLLEHYFQKENQHWHLDERVKQLVQFIEADIFHTPPPEEMDLVCCRYLVFTYFTGQRRIDAAKLLREVLRPHGALMIARKEEMGLASELFEPFVGVEGVFRKRR